MLIIFVAIIFVSIVLTKITLPTWLKKPKVEAGWPKVEAGAKVFA